MSSQLPPPPNKHHAKQQRQRRQVLTEEEYTTNLQAVVQRNFFPDLPRLAETAALHERRAAGDVAGAVAVRRAMRQRQNAQDAELAQQAALDQQAADSVRSAPRPLHLESLTRFHARVTSQDNADFAEQQTKDVQAHRKRQKVEYGTWARRLTNGNNTNNTTPTLPPSNTYVASPLPLASDQFNATPHRKPIQQFAQEAAQKAPTDGLFLLPSGESSTTPSFLSLPPTQDANTSCSSMPPPSNKKAQTISSLSSLVAYIPKESDNKKCVEPAATRFPSSTTTTTTTLSRYRHNGPGMNLEESESEASILNYDSSSATDTSTDLDESPLFNVEIERRLGQRRKAKELETMVQMTPVIVPGESTADDEPLMTWGEVSATPLVLGRESGDDDDETAYHEESTRSEPSFGLTNSARDQAAEKARQVMEQRSRLAAATPPRKKVRSSRPASIFGTRPNSSARSASSFGTALRSSYTPLANAASSRRTSTKRPGHVHRATPKIRSGATGQASKGVPAKSSKDVTNGLLQLS